MTAYSDGADPDLTLARTEDECEQRYAVLTHVAWQMAAADG